MCIRDRAGAATATLVAAGGVVVAPVLAVAGVVPVSYTHLNNYGFGGLIISITGLTWFVAIDYWYGGNKLCIGKQVFCFQRRYEKVYDSYRLFADMAGSAGAGVCAGGNRGAVGPRGTAPAPEETQQTEQAAEKVRDRKEDVIKDEIA